MKRTGMEALPAGRWVGVSLKQGDFIVMCSCRVSLASFPPLRIYIFANVSEVETRPSSGNKKSSIGWAIHSLVRRETEW